MGARQAKNAPLFNGRKNQQRRLRLSSTLKVPFLELNLLSTRNDPKLRCSAMIGANYSGSNVDIVLRTE